MSIGGLLKLARYFRRVAFRGESGVGRLDTAVLSDDLKRDLGLLDGRRPYCEDRGR